MRSKLSVTGSKTSSKKFKISGSGSKDRFKTVIGSEERAKAMKSGFLPGKYKTVGGSLAPSKLARERSTSRSSNLTESSFTSLMRSRVTRSGSCASDWGGSRGTTKTWAPATRTMSGGPDLEMQMPLVAPQRKKCCCPWWVILIIVILSVLLLGLGIWLLIPGDEESEELVSDESDVQQSGGTVSKPNRKKRKKTSGTSAYSSSYSGSYSSVLREFQNAIDNTPNLPGYPRLSTSRKNELKRAFEILFSKVVGRPAHFTFYLYFDKFNNGGKVKAGLDIAKLTRNAGMGKPKGTDVLGYVTQIGLCTWKSWTGPKGQPRSPTHWRFGSNVDGSSGTGRIPGSPIREILAGKAFCGEVRN